MKNIQKKEKNWFSAMLWEDDKIIQERVKKYNDTPWYKSLRFGLLCFVFGSIFLTALFFGPYNVFDWIGMVIFLAPIGYFVMRGYRFTFVLFGIVKLWDSFVRIVDVETLQTYANSTVFSIVVWTVVWIGLCVTCYRVETLRRKTNSDSKRISKTDNIIFILLGALTFLCARGYYLEQTDVRLQLENKYGTQNVRIAEELYSYGVSIPQICETEWKNMLQDYNKEQKEPIVYEAFLLAYIQNYDAVNSEIIESLPEGLFKDYQEKLGESTTQNVINSLKNMEQKNNDVVFTFCSNVLNLSDDEIKITPTLQ